jgi:hypothetical protein
LGKGNGRQREREREKEREKLELSEGGKRFAVYFGVSSIRTGYSTSERGGR